MRKINWALWKHGKDITDTGTITANGYDSAVEDKLLPAHPEWSDNDQVQVWISHPAKGWFFTVGKWRTS